MAARSPISMLPPLLLLLILLGIPGAEGQEVQQPPGPISVLTGEDVILACQVPAAFLVLPVGPVKWFMGKGPTRKLIYSDPSPSDRVTRVAQGSMTNFSIIIRNAVPQDAGTYYCLKQRKLPVFGEDDFESGRGTEVVVRSIPKVRIETTPTSPVHLNDSVTITCNVEGIYPNDISLVWLENGKEKQGKVDDATQNVDQSFTIKSALVVVATMERNLSVFTCRLVQGSQPLVNVDVMLKVGPQSGEDGHSCLSKSDHGAFSSLALGICLFLGKIPAAFFLLYLFIKKNHNQIRLAMQAGVASRK